MVILRMKKVLLFLLPLVFAGMVFGGFLVFMTQRNGAKGALQVTSAPKAKVYLNGKYVGDTPYCKCEYPDLLDVGEYTLRVEPKDGQESDSFEQKISVEKSVLTVVDRSFGGASGSEGSIITLKELPDSKDARLFITSFPDKANVFLDKGLVGQTPLLLKNSQPGNHEIRLQKNGYKEMNINVRVNNGYQLHAIAFFAVDLSSGFIGPQTASPSAAATPSAKLSPSGSPSPTAKISPAVSPKISGTTATGSITILDTPTGKLNVRATPSGSVVGEVEPGDSFTPLSTQAGWYQIKLSTGVTGWVSGQYVKKN